MKIADIKQLKRGDKVFWNDPDNGACSRIYDIDTIQIVNPEMVRILEDGASELECPPKELTKAKKYRAKLYWEMSAEVEVWATSEASAVEEAINAPLPSSDTWEYVPDSANVDDSLDIHEVKE